MESKNKISKLAPITGSTLISLSIVILFAILSGKDFMPISVMQLIVLVTLSIGTIMIGLSQVIFSDKGGLRFATIMMLLSLILWLIYDSIFFFFRFMYLLYPSSALSLSIYSALEISFYSTVIRAFIFSAIAVYSFVFIFYILKRKEIEKSSIIYFAIGILFTFLFVGGLILHGIGSINLIYNIGSTHGGMVFLGIVTFSETLMAVSLAMAIISYWFKDVLPFKSSVYLVLSAILFQLVMFYGLSISFGVGSLFLITKGFYSLDLIMRGFLEVIIFIGICYFAGNFGSAIRGKMNTEELLAIILPVSISYFILILLNEFTPGILIQNVDSIKVLQAFALFLLLILIFSFTMTYFRYIKKGKSKFINVSFPIILLITPLFGVELSNFTTYEMNFQIIFLYIIAIFLSAVYISDTISFLVITDKTISKTEMNNFLDQTDEDIEKRAYQKQTPNSDVPTVIVAEHLQIPIPKYWVGKILWDCRVVGVEKSSNPSFFQLRAMRLKGRPCTMLILKKFSNHGKKLAHDPEVIKSFALHFDKMKKLNDNPYIEKITNIELNTSMSYASDYDLYKTSPPCVILEYHDKKRLSDFNFSLNDVLSVKTFFIAFIKITSLLEEAHNLGIIHGNIGPESVFMAESSGFNTPIWNNKKVGDQTLTEHFNMINQINNARENNWKEDQDSLIISGKIIPKVVNFAIYDSEANEFHEISGIYPKYYPPESTIRNANPGESGDIYQLACLIFEIVATKSGINIDIMNFHARIKFIKSKINNEMFYGSKRDMINDISRFIPEDLRDLNRNVSASLSNVIMKCLDPDPSLRFVHFRDLKKEFIRIAQTDYELLLEGLV
ncbi:MAG: protein kinase family protein [Thermoplasmataceae archaeon]